jgi:hypothetical protein
MARAAIPTFDTPIKQGGIAQTHGIAMGTSVMSLDGAVPVEYLTPGDRIITRSGARRLVSIEITVVENARVIRVAHDTLGIDRPSEDLIVAPSQNIFVRDWRAKALCGTPTALIPASRLVDGEYIRHEVMGQVRLFSLRFDEEVVIYAAGLEIACQKVGVVV